MMTEREITQESGPTPVAHKDEFTVPTSDIDENGHVNNVSHVRWMQEIAVRHFAASGGKPVMHEAGATWVARSHHVEYLRPTFEGDRIQARTWVASFGRVRSVRKYEFAKLPEGTLVAKGETEWVFVDAVTGRPRTIPETLKSFFRTVQD